MIPGNENRTMLSMGKGAKLIPDNEELQMPPIITKVTTGGDRMLR